MIKNIKSIRWLFALFRDSYRLIKYGDKSAVSFFDSTTSEIIKSNNFDFRLYGLRTLANSVSEFLSNYQYSNINENRKIRPDDIFLKLKPKYVKCSLNNEWKNAFVLFHNASGECDFNLDRKHYGIYLFIGRLLNSSNDGILKIFLNNGVNRNKIFEKSIATLPNKWNLFYYKFRNDDLKRDVNERTTIRWELESKKGKIFFGAPLISKKQKSHKKVLFLVLDALRPKDLGIYNTKIKRTPVIDSFFKDGAIFLNSFSQSNWTLPTFASMATSKYASNHCIVDPDLYSVPMSRKIKLLAENLQENGIYTYADMAHRRCNQSLGHHRGYFHFHYEQGGSQGNSAGKQIAKICNMFNNIRDVPIFSFLHIFDIHAPFLQDDSILIESNLNLNVDINEYYSSQNQSDFPNDSYDMIKNIYHAKLKNLDDHLARLFDVCDKHNVTVILTSDHGNSFRNKTNGMNNLSDNNINTPFLIKSPVLPIVGGKYFNIVESSVDLYPTILNIFNLQPPSHCEGTSIFNNSWEVNNKKNGISEVVYKNDYQLKIKNNNNSSLLFKTMRDRSTGQIDFKNLILTKYLNKNGSKNQDLESFKSYLIDSKLSEKLKSHTLDLI